MSEKETKKWKKLSQTIQEEDTAERNEAYNDYVKEVTPTHNLVANMVKAFFTGGTICCIGQFLLNTCQGFGLDKDTSGSWCSLILVFSSVILTGLNIYPSIANWFRSPALPTELPPRRLSSRRRGRSLVLAARFLRSQDRLFCMGFFPAGY